MRKPQQRLPRAPERCAFSNERLALQDLSERRSAFRRSRNPLLRRSQYSLVRERDTLLFIQSCCLCMKIRVRKQVTPPKATISLIAISSQVMRHRRLPITNASSIIPSPSPPPHGTHGVILRRDPATL